MGRERFVLLGLAPSRAGWFRELGQWATSGVIPAEFVKCVSAEEVLTRIGSGRPFSALLADAGLPAVDRDLLAEARSAGCAPIVVDDGRVPRDWAGLGAAAVLPAEFDRDELVGVLTAHARPIPRGEARSDGLVVGPSVPVPSAWRCPVAVVTGAGGTGVSTAAIALAQGLADDVRHAGLVCLADLRLHAEHAMLHDARDVLPSVQELAEGHRAGVPSGERVRAHTFSIAERNYHLLLGLRQARFWSTIRRRAFEATFESLRQAFRVLVCDIDADLEGEDEGGSADVEDRNVMARTAAARADVVFAVGLPTMKGVHALVRVVTELLAFGVEPARLVTVVNCAPRAVRARAALGSTVAELVAPAVARAGLPATAAALASPIFLPERKVDDCMRDGSRVPSALTAPLAGAFAAVMERAPVRLPATGVPEAVRPGSLGQWHEPEVASG
jgi:hypothetical protein